MANLNRYNKSQQIFDSMRERSLGDNRGFAQETRILYSAVVVSNDDEKDSRRVKVRIYELDSPEEKLENLPYCIPLMPNYFYCIPQPGEHVLVLLRNPWTNLKGRYYFGPVMSGEETDNQPALESMEDLNIPVKDSYKSY